MTVGSAGFCIKLALLWLFHRVLGLDYLIAAALAVETALLNAFWWHSRWTWKDRSAGLTPRSLFERLLRFHASTGIVAMTTNLVLMGLLVDGLELNYLVACVVATISAGLMNFISGEWFVFVSVRPAKSVV